MAKYLDSTGLAHFWGKIKALLDTKANNTAINSLDQALGEKVPETRKVAGVDLQDDITVAELVTKLKGTASGTLAEGNHIHDASGLTYTYGGNQEADWTGHIDDYLDQLTDDLQELASNYVTHNHNTSYVPLSRTIAGKQLNSDISASVLTAALDEANSSNKGLMSSAMYTKLNNLPTAATISSTYATKDQLAAQIGSAYKINGSVSSIDALPDHSFIGSVTNILSAFTTNELFKEGAGKQYPAGTNVVVIEADPYVVNGVTYTHQYDVLAGFIDTSKFATKDELGQVTGSIVAITNTEIDTIMAS